MISEKARKRNSAVSFFFFRSRRKIFRNAFAAHAFTIIFCQPHTERERTLTPAQRFGEFFGISKKYGVNIRHSEVGFQQRICHECKNFIGEIFKSGTADSSEEQAGLPSELHEYADGEQPEEIYALRLLFLKQVPGNECRVSDK